MQRLLGLLHRGQEHPMPSSTSLSRDSDAHQLPEEGLHGLHRAAARGDLARLRRHWWLRKRGKNRRDQAKRTPLHLACANGHADVVRFLVQEKCLLNLCDNTGRSPLMMAVESQHEECVAILLEHRADPNLEGYRGKSALHLAAAAPNTSVAEMLVEHGAHLEAKDCERNTPLLLAISSHHKEMVKFLLQKGANVCARNFFGRTALMLAASAGETDVIELLLSYGANIACDTAVDYALRSGHSDLCKKLVEHARCEKTGEASAGAAQDTAVPSRFCSPRTERFALATLALDGEGALPAVGAEQEEEAELPWDRKDQDRQLQLELPGAPESLSVSEAPPEATESQLSDTEKDVERLQEELEMVKAKVEASEQACIESEVWVKYLETVLEDKKREAAASSQKVQGFLEPFFGTGALQKLEERMQGLKAGSDRLEATIQQQSRLIEALQRHQQASASARNHPEDLVTAFQSAQTTADGHPHQQHQCQRTEEKLVELKCPVEVRLEQEMKSNSELRRECRRLRRLLNGALQKLREYEAREREPQFTTARDMMSSCSEGASEADKLTAKVSELSQQLELESKKCMQLEAQNQDLREELSALRGNHEILEKSKCQLKEEVANLRHRLETNMVDHSQIEQYKREMEERAGQEIRQKLQEVNLFLQTQAASQDRLEQIRASHHASLRNQLKHRIKDLECELDRIKNTQQDSIFQKESTQAEVEKYKDLYLEEVKIRRCLANKLERANERLAEANAKLLQERHRSKSLIASSIVGGGLAASPVLYSTELGHLGNNLALNRSLSLGGSFLGTTGNALSSRNRVEAYVAKIRRELDEKITKELEQATAELETGSAGASPMVSTDGSSKNFNVDQDPLCRAIQEYRDVLTKNYLI